MPVKTDRPRVAIAGTSSYIGAAVRDALVDRFDVIALTRSPALFAQQERDSRVQWKQYDPFSRNEVERSLQGVDFAVYLVHNRDPSARLDQALARDRDVLVADNFARGAARAGVKQIVYRTQRLTGSSEESEDAQATAEVIRVLSSYGVPVTVIRTGLVMGPGGEIIRVIVNVVKRLPMVPLPQPERTVYPLSISDLMAAFCYCVGNPETFGRSFEVAGAHAVTFRYILQISAASLGRSTRVVPAPRLPGRALAFLLRIAHGPVHPEFQAYLLDSLRITRRVEDTPVQQAVARRSIPVARMLHQCIQETEQGRVVTRRERQRTRDDEIIRMSGRVRSIQRLHLPLGKNAAWVADHYFSWLGDTLRPLVATDPGPEGSWTIRSGPGRIVLLSLTFIPAQSSPDRRMFYITGGILARFLGGRNARLEFRDVLDGRFTIAAIHDFQPSLPWLFYRFTHAVVHGMVMKGFQLHMAGLVEKTASA